MDRSGGVVRRFSRPRRPKRRRAASSPGSSASNRRRRPTPSPASTASTIPPISPAPAAERQDDDAAGGGRSGQCRRSAIALRRHVPHPQGHAGDQRRLRGRERRGRRGGERDDRPLQRRLRRRRDRRDARRPTAMFSSAFPPARGCGSPATTIPTTMSTAPSDRTTNCSGSIAPRSANACRWRSTRTSARG